MLWLNMYNQSDKGFQLFLKYHILELGRSRARAGLEDDDPIDIMFWFFLNAYPVTGYISSW